MTDRRSLIDGLKQTPPIDPKVEKDFVFKAKPNPTVLNQTGPTPVGEGTQPASPTSAIPVARSPISTRIRVDFATALKRASLERQLSNTEPNTLQDILEEAIQPWLKTNGYLP